MVELPYDQCEECIGLHSSMNDEPYLCEVRPCPFVEKLIEETEEARQ